MRVGIAIPVLIVGGMCWLAAYAAEGARFEAAALVDSYDFAAVRNRKGEFIFDTETAAGNLALLEHVLETGATTILWRNCGGATMRYQSAEERLPLVEAPLDKRRLPSSRPVHGWTRYFSAEPDILRYILDVCHTRGLGAGVHWPFEETHWASWTFGAWNFDHPQFWGMGRQGKIWAGRSSLAYPEVVAHKLRLAEELLERGMRHLFIDVRRTGGWSPAYEYVAPQVAKWRVRYNCDPPTDPFDPRWCALVAETTHNYFVALRQRLKGNTPPASFMLGVMPGKFPSQGPDQMLLSRGIDWKRLVDEGLVDTVVLYDVHWDRENPFESTRTIIRDLVAFCEGKSRVLCPLAMYNFTNRGIPAYCKATGMPAAEVAERLIRIAWEEGADGVNMECVDYNNYPRDMRDTIRGLLEGPCRVKKVLKSE